VATVAASLIIPFFDLDAALVVAEYTPFQGMGMELIAEIPNLTEVELVDDAFDFEGFFEPDDDTSTTICTGPSQESARSAAIRTDLALSKKAITLTSSIVVGVLGITLAKVKSKNMKHTEQKIR